MKCLSRSLYLQSRGQAEPTFFVFARHNSACTLYCTVLCCAGSVQYLTLYDLERCRTVYTRSGDALASTTCSRTQIAPRAHKSGNSTPHFGWSTLYHHQTPSQTNNNLSAIEPLRLPLNLPLQPLETFHLAVGQLVYPVRFSLGESLQPFPFRPPPLEHFPRIFYALSIVLLITFRIRPCIAFGIAVLITFLPNFIPFSTSFSTNHRPHKTRGQYEPEGWIPSKGY